MVESSLTEGKKGSHIVYFSDLRAVSMIAVIILHSFYCAVIQFQPNLIDIQISMLVRNCALWAVPCFVMVSGALLLDPERTMDIHKIREKYLKRTVIALVVFTFLFAVFDGILYTQSGKEILVNFVVNLLTNQSWLHMWYLYLLIGIYLTLPLFRGFVKAADQQTLKYFILVLFVFQSIIPTICYFTNGVYSGFYLLVYGIYPLYLIAGYALHNDILHISRKAAWLMFLFSTTVILICTWTGLQYGNSALQNIGSSYASAAVVIQSVAVFVLFKTSKDTESILTKLNNTIDSRTFGMYLTHVFIIYLFYRVAEFNPYEHGVFFAMLLVAIVSVIGSWLLSVLMDKIPFISKLNDRQIKKE